MPAWLEWTLFGVLAVGWFVALFRLVFAGGPRTLRKRRLRF